MLAPTSISLRLPALVFAVVGCGLVSINPTRVECAVRKLRVHAGATTQEGTNKATPTKPPSAGDCLDVERLRKDVAQLTSEVQRLRRKVSDLEKEQQVNAIREQLLREEKRVEDLQLKQEEIADKDASLQTNLDKVNQQLRPENIDRTLAGVGSTKPEEVRDNYRGGLSTERQRIQTQLDLLRREKARNQASISTAEMMIQRLKQKLAEAMRP